MSCDKIKMMSKNSKNRIYKETRRAIIMGYFKAGERLNVEEIAERYETSITPVRDALQMLSQEGLVTIKARSGYFVTQTTLKELQDMFELRCILEIAGIALAVERITEEQLAELRTVHAGYTGDDDESYDRYTDENRRFHYLLAKASGNQELTNFLGRLLDRLARFMVLRQAGNTIEESHARIIEALAGCDADAVRQALLEDIEGTHRAAIDQIVEKEASAWHIKT